MAVKPALIRAVMAALRFDRPSTAALESLDESDWHSLFDYTDRMHVTLALASRHRDALPPWVRDRLDANIAGNHACIERDRNSYIEIAATLEREGIETTILKGFSHDTPLRPQSDLDLFCPPADASRAQDAVIALGYRPITEPGEFAADHFPTLVRPSNWQWRGDFFDPARPTFVEIHFRLWDPETERIRVDGTEELWTRRQAMTAHGVRFNALDPVDRFAYAALHVLKHMLRGDLILWHIYELGYMLEQHAADDEFWAIWRARYDDAFRQLQTVTFRLARKWFGCRVPESPGLPEAVERWFDVYAAEPGDPLPFPNKSEVWLHAALVPARADALHVIRRKLLPIRKRRLIEPPRSTPRESSLKRSLRRSKFVAGRAAHHVRTLPVASMQGFAWWLRSRGLGAGFFRFLGASSLFNFGMIAFFLLYNLHLAALNFKEDFMGSVASLMTIGTIAGTLPAGFIAGRFGLKLPLLFAFAVTPAICVARTLFESPAALLVTAFLSGFAMAMYMVALTPTVAQLTTEKNRPLAFSLVFSIGIGIGVFGSYFGGKLPRWTGGLQPSLLVVAAIAALGAIPLLKLSLPSRTREKAVYPRDPLVLRFLAALILWSLATGAINPFFNVFFKNSLSAETDTIGSIFSVSQLTQAIAVLSAPLVLRRLGMASGIMSMQIFTGFSLALLALKPPLAGAAVLYASYMAFQYMSEPGMSTYLMDHSKERERGGAAALYMLIIFGGQAVAAKLSGLALVRFGYPAVMATAALLAIIAGLCFRLAMSRGNPAPLERSAAR